MTSTAMAAARLLREYAEELKRSHTIFSSGAWPEGESEAKAAYEQHIAIASALEAMPAKCLHQIQEPAPATAMDALREAEAALEVAMARILKADTGHSICVTSEAKALVAVRAALAAPAPVLVAQPQLHAALFAARGALQHMKEGGKPTQSLLNEAIAAIDSVAVTEAAPAAVAEHGSREERMVVLQRGKDDIPTVWCDPEIADIVGALNSGGIKTVASCSGHGEKPGGIALADGRQLLLLDSLDAFNSAISTLCPSASAPAAVAVPENVREGAPYDNPAFEKLARELGVWGTAQSAVCAQFWLAATPAADAQKAMPWLQVVDEEMVLAHIGVAEASDDYATAKDKINRLICWHIDVAKYNERAAAAPVVLPEPFLYSFEEQVAPIVGSEQKIARTTYTKFKPSIEHTAYYTEQQVRALLATGGQAQAVEQAPVLYVSKGQLDNHRDPDGPDSANAGRYLPARITPAGNFTMPLFAAPQAQAVGRGEVLVTVSGFTGSGKSAIAGEIEILCRALGLQVEWPDGESEKNMTHADWTAALEQYKPRVRIVEQNIPFVSKKGLSK